jgi:hypothetical protein
MQALFLLKIFYRCRIFEGFYGRFPETTILAFKNGICVSWVRAYLRIIPLELTQYE